MIKAAVGPPLTRDGLLARVERCGVRFAVRRDDVREVVLEGAVPFLVDELDQFLRQVGTQFRVVVADPDAGDQPDVAAHLEADWISRTYAGPMWTTAIALVYAAVTAVRACGPTVPASSWCRGGSTRCSSRG